MAKNPAVLGCKPQGQPVPVPTGLVVASADAEFVQPILNIRERRCNQVKQHHRPADYLKAR